MNWIPRTIGLFLVNLFGEQVYTNDLQILKQFLVNIIQKWEKIEHNVCENIGHQFFFYNNMTNKEEVS